MITIKLSEHPGYARVAPKRVLLGSLMLATMLGECDEADDGASEAVKLATAAQADLECIELPTDTKPEAVDKVIDYLTRHVDDPMKTIDKPCTKDSLLDAVGGSDADFVGREMAVPFVEHTDHPFVDLWLAANYLDCPPLFDLCTAAVVFAVKGKEPEEVSEMFGMLEDITREEEDMVRERCPWITELRKKPTGA